MVNDESQEDEDDEHDEGEDDSEIEQYGDDDDEERSSEEDGSDSQQKGDVFLADNMSSEKHIAIITDDESLNQDLKNSADQYIREIEIGQEILETPEKKPI